jgi:hypothetical protein
VIDVPQATEQREHPEPLCWWWWGFAGDEPRYVVLRCPNGHEGTLRHLQARTGHEIAADGKVSPSAVCPEDECDFHEFVRLTGWRQPGTVA